MIPGIEFPYLRRIKLFFFSSFFLAKKTKLTTLCIQVMKWKNRSNSILFMQPRVHLIKVAKSHHHNKMYRKNPTSAVVSVKPEKTWKVAVFTVDRCIYGVHMSRLEARTRTRLRRSNFTMHEQDRINIPRREISEKREIKPPSKPMNELSWFSTIPYEYKCSSIL